MGKKARTSINPTRNTTAMTTASSPIQNDLSGVLPVRQINNAYDDNQAKNALTNPVRRSAVGGYVADGHPDGGPAGAGTDRGSFSATVGWPEAVADFLLQTRATREENTERFYHERLRLLSRWSLEKDVPLDGFRARHLREYLAHRADQGVSDQTRRHDAVAARAFLKFCMREGYVEGDPLMGYQVPKAERAYVKCPSDDEIRALLKAMHERWKPASNPAVRFIRPAARQFFSRRNYALVTGLIETGARIGEMLALTLDDYQPEQGQIAIRHAKGDAPRVVPISLVWIDAVAAYLRVRPKVDCNRLFVSEYGGPMDVARFGRQFRGYLEFAGLSGFTLHGLRHYAITQLAKTDVWAVSQIAGHKDLKITRQYLHGDPAHVRAAHDAAAPLARILVNVRSERQRRKKVI